MRILPAIDLHKGQAVRLRQGRLEEATVYYKDPVEAALRWEAEGGDVLHLVDLDAAVHHGERHNRDQIRAIVEAVRIPVELGGGIRSLESARELVDLGVARLVIGTRAAQDPDFMRLLIQEFGPDRVIGGVDARDGKVAVAGWTETTAQDVVDLVRAWQALGVREVIYTDIKRDGMLTGPHLEGLTRLALATGASVIASGGMSTLADVENVIQLESLGVTGVILGRALYENAISLPEAARLARTAEADRREQDTMNQLLDARRRREGQRNWHGEPPAC